MLVAWDMHVGVWKMTDPVKLYYIVVRWIQMIKAGMIKQLRILASAD